MARAQWRKVADQLNPKAPKLATVMDEAELACMSRPAQHRAKLHSPNPIERVNGEIKRTPRSWASSQTRTLSFVSSARSCSSRTTRGRPARPLHDDGTIAPLSDDPMVWQADQPGAPPCQRNHSMGRGSEVVRCADHTLRASWASGLRFVPGCCCADCALTFDLWLYLFRLPRNRSGSLAVTPHAGIDFAFVNRYCFTIFHRFMVGPEWFGRLLLWRR